MENFHDYYIISYKVDIEKEVLVLCCYDEIKKEKKFLYFKDVLTHQFEQILLENIIPEISENSIESFFKYKKDLLEEKKYTGWPIGEKNLKQSLEVMLQEGYKYITISSSLGLKGFIICKSYSIK